MRSLYEKRWKYNYGFIGARRTPFIREMKYKLNKPIKVDQETGAKLATYLVVLSRNPWKTKEIEYFDTPEDKKRFKSWHKTWDCKINPVVKKHWRTNEKQIGKYIYRVEPYCKYCGKELPKGHNETGLLGKDHWTKTYYKKMEWYVA